MCVEQNQAVIDLVAECVLAIDNGQTGWFYVRECFGGINAGWNPVPIPDLPGVIWSRLA